MASVMLGRPCKKPKDCIARQKYAIWDKQVELPLVRHFVERSHTVSQIYSQYMAIDHIPKLMKGGDRKLILKKKAVKWINYLNTLQPLGLNVNFDPPIISTRLFALVSGI